MTLCPTILAARRHAILRGLGPAMSAPGGREALRAAFGAGLGIAICGALLLVIGRLIGNSGNVILIAPLGATTFLVFAVPNSPLAQPWSAIVGNAASALVAVSVLSLGLPTEMTAALAILGAMIAMATLRAMHPPGAAVALAAVLSAVAGPRPGFDFVLAPVALDTCVIVALAILYNRLTGRVYPFRQSDPTPVAEARLGLSAEDIRAILDHFRLGANIGSEDFGRVLAAAEEEAARRYFAQIVCVQIMTRDLVVVRPQTRLTNIQDLFRRHRFKSLPVVDGDGRYQGLITQNDVIRQVLAGPRVARSVSRFLQVAGPGGVRASDLMSVDSPVVSPGDELGELLHLLADGLVQAAPVVDGDRLVGMITRSDLLRVLVRRSLLASVARQAA